MFREMRRKDKSMPESEAVKFLEQESYGVLCLLGDDDYPYGVPLNYSFSDGYIYLHGGLQGHKIDAINNHPKVCFTVFGDVENLPKDISTNFTSVIAFGTASIIPMEDEAARQSAFESITFKYSPKDENSIGYIEKAKGKTAAIKIKVEHITGKSHK